MKPFKSRVAAKAPAEKDPFRKPPQPSYVERREAWRQERASAEDGGSLPAITDGDNDGDEGELITKAKGADSGANNAGGERLDRRASDETDADARSDDEHVYGEMVGGNMIA